MSSIINGEGDTIWIFIGGIGGDNVYGHVKDNNRDGVSGATVFVYDVDSEEYLRATTGSDGEYEKDLDAADGHRFQAFAFFTDASGREHYISGNIPAEATTPANSPFAKGVFLIYVAQGTGLDVAHPCVAVNGMIYSFEGPGLLHYPNVGAYINRRRTADGRRVYVYQVPHIDANKVIAEARTIRRDGPDYNFTSENCALNSARLLNAGSSKHTFLDSPFPPKFLRMNQAGLMTTPGEITTNQVE